MYVKYKDFLSTCLLTGAPSSKYVVYATAATTAARKVVSFSTLIGPFEFERALTTLLYHLASGRCRQPANKPLRKAEEVNSKSKFSFFTSLSAAEAHVFGVKFIGLYGTVVFIAIRDFSF